MGYLYSPPGGDEYEYRHHRWPGLFDSPQNQSGPLTRLLMGCMAVIRNIAGEWGDLSSRFLAGADSSAGKQGNVSWATSTIGTMFPMTAFCTTQDNQALRNISILSVPFITDSFHPPLKTRGTKLPKGLTSLLVTQFWLVPLLSLPFFF